MNTYTIYTDGACTNNGSPFAQAGWKAVLANPQGDTLEIAGPVPEGQHQTNSRAELMAVAEALEQCKQPAPIDSNKKIGSAYETVAESILLYSLSGT